MLSNSLNHHYASVQLILIWLQTHFIRCPGKYDRTPVYSSQSKTPATVTSVLYHRSLSNPVTVHQNRFSHQISQI